MVDKSHSCSKVLDGQSTIIIRRFPEHVMKATLSTPAPTKIVRKTPTRRAKPAAVETAPVATPPALIPPLTATFGAPLRIIFQDLGGKEVISEVPGCFTLAKRLAMAYAVVTKTSGSYTGIACADLTSAFEVTDFDQAKNRITVRLVPGTPTIELTSGGDPEYEKTKVSRVHTVPREHSSRSTFPFQVSYSAGW